MGKLLTLEEEDNTELNKEDKIRNIKRHKIELFRVHLSPSMNIISNPITELDSEKEPLLIDEKNTTLKNIIPTKEHITQALKLKNRIIKKDVEKKYIVRARKLKINNFINQMKEKSKIDLENEKIYTENKISLGFTFTLLFIIITSTLGGLFFTGYLSKSDESNLFGLLVFRDGVALSDIIRIDGSQSQQFIIHNTKSNPVTLKYIAWSWNPLDMLKKVNISWDYDGSIIEPGFSRKVNLHVVSELGKQDFSYNIIFMSRGTQKLEHDFRNSSITG
jgi:hypothetical protein